MIIKRRVTRQFVQLENALVRDRRLDLDEHGMLHYLLSLPDDWEVSQTQCAKFWGIGRDKCRRIFRSLRRTGWAQLERLQSDDGMFIGARWIIGDEPGPETSDEALDQETLDDGDATPPTTETTAAPESQSPAALVSGDHATPLPSDGEPVGRMNHATEKASHGRIKSLEENRDSKNTPPAAARDAEPPLGTDDDDDGEPPPRFGELLRLWPADNVVSPFACERVFVKFSDKQKREARDGVRPYLADCRSKGQNRLCDLRTYLDERRWERFVGKPGGHALYAARRGTPQAMRWREHFERTDPGKLRLFDELIHTRGAYTVPSEWPPSKAAVASSAPHQGAAISDREATDFVET